MIHGVDADFLVAVEVSGHVFHGEANLLLDTLLDSGHTFALAPQTLAEFIHVVTDAKRLPVPLVMTEALERAERHRSHSCFPRWHDRDRFLCPAPQASAGAQAATGYHAGRNLPAARHWQDHHQQ